MLLDGGYGSFALSVSKERIWKDRVAADWSWSSNLPHHVTVTDDEVAVVRWDKPEPEVFTPSSVANRIGQFYRYLTHDRVQSTQRVTDHMLMTFRRVRSLVAAAQIDDDRSIDAYLAFLARAINRSHPRTEAGQAYVGDEDLLGSLASTDVDALLEEVTSRSLSELPLALVPSLAVRHAGSEVFQEAHFELRRTSTNLDLFGYIDPAKGKRITRGSTHFTPPALARSIAEQALAQLPDLAERERLTILDPACGSGSFLYEALRALRRDRFRGRLTLVGRDTSRPAVSMARFVLQIARADWSPDDQCDIDIQQADSLAAELPQADVVLMNPPFVAWPALTTEQRQQMHDILGLNLHGRSDLSMAFVSRALDSITLGGVLATLLPGSLLTLQAAEAWRKHLLDQADLRLIASLGDYGLFSYATVNVAAAVLMKPRSDRDRQESVAALVATSDPDATGDALRALRRRRMRVSPDTPSSRRSWRLFHIMPEKLARQSTWRLISPKIEKALSHLVQMERAVPIGDLFNVRQGVRTGLKSAFLLTERQIEKLPQRERKWFLPAILNDSIRNGQIRSGHRVFYPYDQQGLAITSEADLTKQLPAYFDCYLRPIRSRLKERCDVRRAKQPYWWRLSQHRTWALDPRPRLVSKYFGAPGGFATDLDARYIVVQGYAWLPKWTTTPTDQLRLEDALAAYMALMNSTPFGRLLELFAPHVAGGQFDLSPRYVRPMPVPNLPALYEREPTNPTITGLAELGHSPQINDPKWCSNVDRLTTKLFGGDIFRQV
ncbi:HsdM family class I SAM-dependent methyltransferase [Candidatus Palauibacter sp.]|uniref:HsdM family class I SAM-dependent methyltransferase n=1 Tax=Candidatus Palauibacter sp. TaxID=3101350 RepID=UPI003B0275F8